MAEQRLIDAEAFLKTEIDRCGSDPLVGTCTSDNEYLSDRLKKLVLQKQNLLCMDTGLAKMTTVMNGYLFAQIVTILMVILSMTGLITVQTVEQGWTNLLRRMINEQ